MEVEQVTLWGSPAMEIEGTIEKKEETIRLDHNNNPKWNVDVSSPLEAPHGFGQLKSVRIFNVFGSQADKLVEGGRYKLNVTRGDKRKDQVTGVEPDGSTVDHFWWNLKEVLERLEATPELQKAAAAAPVNAPSERVYEQMQRDATQREEPTSRVILGAERGNAWNVVQEMITTHIQATGSYPFPTDWNGPDDPESRPMTLEELASLHAEAVELILQHNTASEQKVRF